MNVDKATFTKKSDAFRYIDGTLKVSSVVYTGVHHAVIVKEQTKDKMLTPGKAEVISITIDEATYLSKLVDQCLLTISGLFIVSPTNESHPIHYELRLRKPHLKVDASSSGKKGVTLPVTVTFTNPLSVTLTGCELRAEGAGLQKPLIQKCGDVPPKTEFVGKFDITPRKIGTRELSIVFSSKQLYNINGSHEVNVD